MWLTTKCIYDHVFFIALWAFFVIAVCTKVFSAFWAFFVIAVFKVCIPTLLLFFVTCTDTRDGLESWVGTANTSVALGKVKLKAYNSPDFGFPTLVFYAYGK